MARLQAAAPDWSFTLEPAAETTRDAITACTWALWSWSASSPAFLLLMVASASRACSGRASPSGRARSACAARWAPPVTRRSTSRSSASSRGHDDHRPGRRASALVVQLPLLDAGHRASAAACLRSPVLPSAVLAIYWSDCWRCGSTRAGWPRESSRRRRSATSEPTRESRALILIVDDDASVTASLAPAPEAGGLRVAGRGDPGGGAGARSRAATVDLVLQDMNFSRETTRRRRPRRCCAASARAPELPVILITAWGSIELAVRGHEGGRRGLRHQALDQRPDPAGGARPRSASPRRAPASRGARCRRARSSTPRTTSARSSGAIPRLLRVLESSAGWRRPTPRS